MVFGPRVFFFLLVMVVSHKKFTRIAIGDCRDGILFCSYREVWLLFIFLFLLWQIDIALSC